MTDKDLIAKLKTKITTRRSEIARLLRKVDVMGKENADLTREIKWMKGDKT
jgi:hypothetical protein